MKKAKKTAEVTIVAYELREEGPAGVTETIRVDDLRAADGETDAQAQARATRKGWARKSLLDWLKMRGVSVARVMSDGSKIGVDISELRATLDAPDGAVPISSMIVPTVVEARKVGAKGKADARHAADCGCDACVNARDVARGVVVRSGDVVALKKKITIEIVAATPPPPPREESSAPTVFTIGYDGGLTVGRLLNIAKERLADFVVDMRHGSRVQRAPGWKEADLRRVLGARYLTRDSLSNVGGRRNAVVLLLRKEEAPGDCGETLALAKQLIKAGARVVHLYQGEEIEAAEFQRSIDAGNDYDCEIDIPDPTAEAIAS